MAKYVLIYTGGGMPESEEEQAAVLARWTEWYTGLGAAVVDPGYPLGMAKSIAHGQVSGGAFGSPPASGYTILEADSLDDAVAMGKSCPILDGGAGQVSVYETIEMG